MTEEEHNRKTLGTISANWAKTEEFIRELDQRASCASRRKLDDFDSLVTRLLDGSRDRPAILAALEKWAADDVFEISHGGQPVQDEAQRREALADCLGASIDAARRVTHRI